MKKDFVTIIVVPETATGLEKHNTMPKYTDSPIYQTTIPLHQDNTNMLHKISFIQLNYTQIILQFLPY